MDWRAEIGQKLGLQPKCVEWMGGLMPFAIQTAFVPKPCSFSQERECSFDGKPGTVTGMSTQFAKARPKSCASANVSVMQYPIQHEEADAKGAFYMDKGGEHIAEMTYSRTNATMIIVDHTHVDDSLRGQGAGRQLLDALVAWARKTGTKVLPLCPYAKAQFDKDASIRDVLV